MGGLCGMRSDWVGGIGGNWVGGLCGMRGN
jgi:hypothetical protein